MNGTKHSVSSVGIKRSISAKPSLQKISKISPFHPVRRTRYTAIDLDKRRKIQQKQTETLINRALEWAYDRAVNGLGVMRTVEVLAEAYLKHHAQDQLKSASDLMLRQGSKAALNGFCMNFGGVLFLPLTLPTGILTSLYIQLRMITVMAVIGGYDVHDPRVKTLCYICLAGNNAEKIFKSAGMKAGGKVSAAMLSTYMTGDIIKILHKALGTQAIAHFSPMGVVGPAGAVSLGRFVPVAGGFLSGAWASYTTRQIGKVARRIFIENHAEEVPSS